ITIRKNCLYFMNICSDEDSVPNGVIFGYFSLAVSGNVSLIAGRLDGYSVLKCLVVRWGNERLLPPLF
ncbi:hypothetical protein, partial [Klebsiella pneumoniae]|uniref:hypothetical protein n=1 Tax=Klebsiella pneumoniae TaxID=573 RepID=UPI00405550DE